MQYLPPEKKKQHLVASKFLLTTEQTETGYRNESILRNSVKENLLVSIFTIVASMNSVAVAHLVKILCSIFNFFDPFSIKILFQEKSFSFSYDEELSIFF